MTIRELLSSPVISMLLLPCRSTLFLLIKPLLRILQYQEETMSLTWPLNFDSLDHYLSVFDQDFSIRDTDVGISKYRRTVSDEQARCVFCLSDVVEGEEIRKLRCSHLFHRICLDKWLQYQKLSCPLCRCSLLASLEVQEKLNEVEDEVEPEDSGPPLLAFVLSEWWGRCFLLVEHGFS
ncbi:E3 ubiquitin-protein ligase RHA2B-like [Phalaenopsis equestris]|uniref:E3 ubiquitin-protein ligase RHA2B-like n=1 Tax=Phalaenopsis equestris TaxID=78828 RepID=UPI0009E1EFC2|nr:E3 ubiquitin-protein ligase RHA2B-like [Phalaenopsis equestris]